MDTQKLRQECIDFARRHLRECAQELLAWQDTGTLADGKLRELERMVAAWVGDHDALGIAEHLVEREALRRCGA